MDLLKTRIVNWKNLVKNTKFYNVISLKKKKTLKIKHLSWGRCFWSPQTHFSKSKINYVIHLVSWTQTSQQILWSSCSTGHSFYRWERIPASPLLSRMTDGQPLISWHGSTGPCNPYWVTADSQDLSAVSRNNHSGLTALGRNLT